MDIYNKATDTIEFDLTGEFGDDFFYEGISKDKLLNILNENKESNLIINLSSLGGSVDTAFAVRDWVLKHNGLTTVRLLGRNASSSTVFATAFDITEMSENGLFLVHNVWGGAVGEADEFRKQADEMDKHNDAIISMFRKKTGQTKSKIKSLMNENKWITANEAKDFGFVDKIFKPTKSQNKYNKSQINNKYLPIMENEKKEGIFIKDEKTFFDKFKNFINPEIKDISDETKKDFETEKTELTNRLDLSKTEVEKSKTNILDLKEKLEQITAERDSLKIENEKLSNKTIEPKKDEDVEDTRNVSKEDQEWIDTANTLKNKNK